MELTMQMADDLQLEQCGSGPVGSYATYSTKGAIFGGGVGSIPGYAVGAFVGWGVGVGVHTYHSLLGR